MAYDAWGGSWAGSWALTWTGEHTSMPPAPPAQQQPSAGNIRWDKKRRQRVIRYSDFESQEAYAAAIAAAARPMVELPPTDAPQDDWEDAEDTMIAFQLMRLLH